MRVQLRDIKNEFVAAEDRLRQLISQVSDDQWCERPEPGRWSAAECIAHLNITSRTYLPVLDTALDEARRLGEAPEGRYRRDLTGWLLWKTMGPPVRLRMKTTAQFVPGAAESPTDLAAEFERLQRAQIEVIEQADGLQLDKVRVASPFNPRVRYNLFSCLSILPRHQHRHLWQAEMAIQALKTTGKRDTPA